MTDEPTAEDTVEDFLNELDGWESAYPLTAFPEPDLVKAAKLLKEGGMTLDAVSASNMRHVVSCIAPKARAAILAMQATQPAPAMEGRTSAKNAQVATPDVEQMQTRLLEIARTTGMSICARAAEKLNLLTTLSADVEQMVGQKGSYFAAMEHVVKENAALSARLRDAEEALKPFAADDYENPVADENGWTDFGVAWSRERIVDWFGPSDFRRARATLGSATQEEKSR